MAEPQSAPPVFSSLQDSPLFRGTVSELEAAQEQLKQRASLFTKGGRRLVEGAAAGEKSSSAFADALERFCASKDEGPADDEELMLRKVAASFRELATAQGVLRLQLELVLCDLPDRTLSGLLTEQRDTKRRMEKLAGAYDAARLKHLGHKSAGHISTWKSSSDPEKTQAGMWAAKGEADAARYELARKLVEVDGAGKAIFMEAMVHGMEAHISYFKHSLELVQSLQACMAESREAVDRTRAEAAAQAEGLEAMIAAHAAEEAAAREAAAAADASSSGRPAGPLQMSAGTAALATEMEAFIRQTQASGHKVVTLLKQGYLLKQSSNALQAFQRRYFCLSSDGLLWYYSTKEKSSKGGTPKNTVTLLTATVKPNAEDPSMKYAFRVVSPEKELTLQAESAADAQEWMQAIQSVIACLLSGEVSHSALPKKPSLPTHSRSSSVDVSLLSLGEGPLGGGLAAARSSGPARGEGGLPGYDESVTSRPSSAAGAAGPGSSRQTSYCAEPGGGASIRDVLWQVPGNAHCIDCGAPNPQWASLQLGVLLCVECSGAHRGLGVEYSKVRSLTMDVKVWDADTVGLFQQLGNAFANQVWEAGMAAAPSGRPHTSTSLPEGENPFSASDDDEELVDVLLHARHAVSGTAADAGPGSSGGRPRKPSPDASGQERAAFVTAKYVDRAFVVRPPACSGPEGQQKLQEWLWQASHVGDLRSAYRALAAGAKPEFRYSNFQPATQLVWEASFQAEGNQDQPVSPTNLAGVTALHAACRSGSALLVELLSEAGALVDEVDVFRRSALHYAILYDHPEIAKQLLRRGARSSRDRLGLTPAQHAERRGCRDAELLALLNKAV